MGKSILYVITSYPALFQMEKRPWTFIAFIYLFNDRRPFRHYNVIQYRMFLKYMRKQMCIHY